MSDMFSNDKRSPQTWSSLCEAFADATYGIAVADVQGRFLDANGAYCALTGYSLEELRGTTFAAITHPDDLRLNIAQINRLKSGEVLNIHIEKRYRRKDGSHIPVKNHALLVRDELGKPSTIVVFTEDITRRREAEKELGAALAHAQAADRAKSEFIAAMSHELRTPLNAVIGFAEMIRSEAVGPLGRAEYADYAGHIYDSGHHLLVLINDILDLSHMASGQLALSESIIDVRETILRSVDAILPEVEKKSFAVSVDVAPTLHLIADRSKIDRILGHLLSNAVKFTPAGGKIDVRATMAADREIEIAVSDTGIGMLPEQIPLALEPFRQIDGALGRKYEGTGLGLALTKRLVELHGGTLSVDSSLGVGTRAVVRFPPHRTHDTSIPPKLSLS